MTDPIDLLRSANPVTDTDKTTLNHDQMLRAITRDNAAHLAPAVEATPAADRPVFSPPPSREAVSAEVSRGPRTRRVLAGVAAAGLVGAMGFGVASLIPASSTPAAAAMVNAATATEAADSGTVMLTFSLEGGTDAESLSLFTRFDGDDLSASFAGAQGPFASEVPTGLEARIVDGEIFASDGQSWYHVDDPRARTALELAGFPINVGDAAAAVSEIVTATDGVVEVEPGRFTGTVTAAELREVAADNPSVSVFTDQILGSTISGSEFDDEEISIDMRVDENGAIDVISVGTVAQASETNGLDEDVSGTLVIDFEDLGSEQVIERPADAQPLDLTELAD